MCRSRVMRARFKRYAYGKLISSTAGRGTQRPLNTIAVSAIYAPPGHENRAGRDYKSRTLIVVVKAGAFDPLVHRHRIPRPQRENRSNVELPDRCALSRADQASAPPHALFVFVPENGSNWRNGLARPDPRRSHCD